MSRAIGLRPDPQIRPGGAPESSDYYRPIPMSTAVGNRPLSPESGLEPSPRTAITDSKVVDSR